MRAIAWSIRVLWSPGITKSPDTSLRLPAAQPHPLARGVQYVHCVMHKCIMVKVGGYEKHIKYVKHVNFTKMSGEFAKVGEKRNFGE